MSIGSKKINVKISTSITSTGSWSDYTITHFKWQELDEKGNSIDNWHSVKNDWSSIPISGPVYNGRSLAMKVLYQPANKFAVSRHC
jgi:hypothetical protein